MSETCKDLREATPEELVESFLWFHRESLTDRESSLVRLGRRLAGPDGWEQIAPAWLREYRKVKKA